MDREIIVELFSLWKSLAETGELSIGVGFHDQYKRLNEIVTSVTEQTIDESLLTGDNFSSKDAKLLSLISPAARCLYELKKQGIPLGRILDEAIVYYERAIQYCKDKTTP